MYGLADSCSQVLVPHHHADTNPLRRCIATMALDNDALMNLLLAYSGMTTHQGPKLFPPFVTVTKR